MGKEVPMRVLEAYEKEYGIPHQEAVEHFQELHKFLEACATSEKRCAPSAKMDKVWHCFLQFPLEYREYCLANFGCLIDHDPTPKEANMEAYVYTREKIAMKYGWVDATMWPEGGNNADVCGAIVKDAKYLQSLVESLAA
jgi:hypothetical protein